MATQTQGITTRTDHNIWAGISYDDALGARAWLRALGFAEGILVQEDDGTVTHSEMVWPEGGRVMVHSRGKQDDATPDLFADAVAVGDKPPPKAGVGSGAPPAKPPASSSGTGDDSLDMAAFAERSYLT